MKKYFYAALGGAAGTLLRCLLFRIPLAGGAQSRVWMTFAINISGSFFLGLLTALFLRKARVREEIRVALTAGLLGGYTTFSTMCRDTVNLMRSGAWLMGAVYIVLSVTLGLAAAWAGARTVERGWAE